MSERIPKPSSGTRIDYSNGAISVPDDPIVPFIEGDGTGPDIWRATRHVVDGTLKKVYGGKKSIVWHEVYAGEKANQKFGEYLPQETLDALRYYRVSIKGPLTTPIGGGIRSLNVTLRQVLDLYACVRPVKYFEGVPSPVREPKNINMTIYRENTEDVYAGIEWPAGSEKADKIIGLVNDMEGRKDRIRAGSAIGIKPISEFGSKRLVRKAIQYAIATKRSSVTLVHKGNIMKFTEGAFKDWGYQVARDEFANVTIPESELGDGKTADGKIVIKDRIADSMFQQVLLRPSEYSVIATTNLNGDYLSDALAAQVGGLGMAPGSNESDEVAIFEATHGTAPKYANKDMINPGSLILSAVMMLRHMKWWEAAEAIERAIAKTIAQKRVTYDLERQMQGATKLSTSEFGKAIVDNV
jgi:isocitrate dehydrogenase